MEVLIIGGGAAGMAAAIAAAQQGAEVTLLERMDRVGKKLLATGNGRCNLMNTGAPCYPGGADFAAQVLSQCGTAEQTAFWHELGLRLRTEDGGRVYPVSGQASSVLDALRLGMEHLGVHVETNAAVEAIAPGRNGWQVRVNGAKRSCDKLIVTAGGCAQPKLGSDGSLWPMLEGLGHHVNKPRPALTQIMTETLPIKGLSGIRVKADVSVVKKGRILHEETGEVLFADYGLSGVCVMQCARFAEKGSNVTLNLLSGMGFADEKEARQEIFRRRVAWGDLPMEKLLTGLCVPRLASSLCMEAGIRFRDRMIGSLKDGEIAALAHTLAAFELPVKGVKGFDTAQVSAGGLEVAEFNAATMASRLLPGLYAAGEVLDVDGTCGGFNLMFAFGSGIIAGRACAGGKE